METQERRERLCIKDASNYQYLYISYVYVRITKGKKVKKRDIYNNTPLQTS